VENDSVTALPALDISDDGRVNDHRSKMLAHRDLLGWELTATEAYNPFG
jgi:hypothetical protein